MAIIGQCWHCGVNWPKVNTVLQRWDRVRILQVRDADGQVLENLRFCSTRTDITQVGSNTSLATACSDCTSAKETPAAQFVISHKTLENTSLDYEPISLIYDRRIYRRGKEFEQIFFHKETISGIVKTEIPQHNKGSKINLTKISKSLIQNTIYLRLFDYLYRKDKHKYKLSKLRN